jgi:hypothetical protein
VYDLHLLRQLNENAACFSSHLDIHDTGDAATSQIAAGFFFKKLKIKKYSKSLLVAAPRYSRHGRRRH